MGGILDSSKMEHPGDDYHNKWYVMMAVGMGVFLATIDGSIVNVALPTIIKAFNTDFATVEWVVLSYLLTITVLMLSIGRLSDIIGKKKIYAWGFVIFTIGSALCGLSWTIHSLIGFRVIQAIGASMVIALGMAIVTEACPPKERGMALGISGAVVSVGIVLGPTLGGFLIDTLSWHWIFFVNLPVGILGTILVIIYIPANKPVGHQSFDYLGAFVLFLSLFSLLLALTLGQNLGFSHWFVISLFLAALTFSIVFILVEHRSKHPMLDLHLFDDITFSTGLVTALITFISISGTIFLMPFYLENVLHYNARQVGLLLAVVPIVLAILSPLSGYLSDKFGTRLITVIGLFLLLIGYAALTTLRIDTSAAGFILRFLFVGIGMGVFQSPNNSAIMGAAPRERLGVVSGILAITRSLGQTTGIALLGSIWAGLVLSMNNNQITDGITTALPQTQVAALSGTFTVVVILITIGLVVGVWAWVIEYRQSKLDQLTTLKDG